MNSTKNNASENKKQLKTILILCTLAFLLAVVSSVPAFRNFFSDYQDSHRIILSKIFTNYDGINFVAFKIKMKSGIELEIYEKEPVTFNQKLKQKFTFPNDQDAFLTVDGNSVNLALSDIDQDNIKEIIMPTVDQFGVSRLNVIKYNIDLKQFSQSAANN